MYRFYQSIKYLHVGEYGGNLGRPHYHAIMFGLELPDMYFWRTSKSGYKCYRSPLLESVWTDGNSEIGSVTMASCTYVALYVLAKEYGDQARDHYFFYDGETGEYLPRRPEYCTMSRGGRTGKGIGYSWLAKYWRQVYNEHFDDHVSIDGFKHKVPRYYDKLMESFGSEEADLLFFVQERRVERAKRFAEESTPERLAVRERVSKAKSRLGKRDLR